VQSHGVSLKFRECNAPNPRGIRLGIAIEAACAFSVYYFVCHGEAMGLGEFAQDVMEFVRVQRVTGVGIVAVKDLFRDSVGVCVERGGERERERERECVRERERERECVTEREREGD